MSIFYAFRYNTTLFFCLALLLGGCATIISGKHQVVDIRSSPAAAHIKIERAHNGAMLSVWEGLTPSSIPLERKYTYQLTVSLDGYQPIEMGLANGSNGWVWGNLLLGGFIGLIVDFSNGAAKTLEPDEIDIELVSLRTTSAAGLSRSNYAVLRIKNHDASISTSVVPLMQDPDFPSLH